MNFVYLVKNCIYNGSKHVCCVHSALSGSDEFKISDGKKMPNEILMSQGYLPSVWQQKHNDKDVLKSCYSNTCLNIHIYVKMFFEK